MPLHCQFRGDLGGRHFADISLPLNNIHTGVDIKKRIQKLCGFDTLRQVLIFAGEVFFVSQKIMTQAGPR